MSRPSPHQITQPIRGVPQADPWVRTVIATPEVTEFLKRERPEVPALGLDTPSLDVAASVDFPAQCLVAERSLRAREPRRRARWSS